MDKITPAARREFSFPVPVDVHGQRVNEQNKKENDERQPPFKAPNLSARRGRFQRAVREFLYLLGPIVLCRREAIGIQDPGSVFTIDLAVELGVFAIPRKLPTRQPLAV